MMKLVGYIVGKIRSLSDFKRVLLLLVLGLLASEAVLRKMGLYQQQLKFSYRELSVRFFDLTPDYYRPQVVFDPPVDFSKMDSYSYQHYLVRDPVYGLSNRPASNLHIFKSHNKLIWNVTYNIDNLGRRKTPGADRVNTEAFMVFYGGSRTFGQGVEDGETLPAQFQKQQSQYKIYNYGIIGAGPNVFLRKHENGLFQKEIPEKRGVFLYVFDAGHESRMLGAQDVVWGFDWPYYRLGRNSEVTFEGTFMKDRFFLSAFYSLASFSAIYYNLSIRQHQFNGVLSHAELLFIRKFFVKMRAEAEKSGSRFFPVFFQYHHNPKLMQIQQAFKDEGIETFVFSQEQLPPDTPDNYFEYDGHPRPPVYVTQAELLRLELRKRNLIDK